MNYDHSQRVELMRVLFIIPNVYGPPWAEGVNNIARRLVQYLKNRNDDVAIVSYAYDGRTSMQQTGEYGETLLYVPRRKNHRHWNRFRLSISMITLVCRLAQKRKPDVVVLFASASLFLGPRAFILRSFLGSRLILYISGLNKPMCAINWLLHNTRIIVGSPFLLRWFPQATIAYPLLPTHLRPLEYSKTRRHARESFSILYLGASQKERGVEYLLKGVSLARQRTQCALRLTLALNGAGSENSQIRQMISYLGLEDIVSVHGIVDINEAYGNSDVLIIPRQQPIRMSFPVRILESLSYNIPVIVTSMCDMGDLIHGCGLEVDSRDPGDLAEAIVRLAEDSDLYNRLSSNCPTVLQKYETNRTLITICSVLKGAANQRN